MMSAAQKKLKMKLGLRYVLLVLRNNNKKKDKNASVIWSFFIVNYLYSIQMNQYFNFIQTIAVEANDVI